MKNSLDVVQMTCPKHGLTDFVIECCGRYRCKKCRVTAVSDTRKKNKLALVEYKGGKCEICGYDKCVDALEFHHLNPLEKEFGISNGNIKSLNRLKIEADKCIMICANCHRELHAIGNEKQNAENEKLENINILAFSVEDEGKKRNIRNINGIKNLTKEDILDDIKNHLSKKEMSTKYNLGISTIIRFLKKNSIEYVEQVKKSESLTVDIVIEALKKYKSINPTAHSFGMSDNGLRKWLKKNNLPFNREDIKLFLESN